MKYKPDYDNLGPKHVTVKLTKNKAELTVPYFLNQIFKFNITIL